jgi:outer membrane protein TolC
MRKRAVCFVALLFFLQQIGVAQQHVTLEQCYEWTVLNAPVFSQKGKYEQLADIKQLEAIWNYLPKFEINARASYQDPVITIEQENGAPLPLFPIFPHDNYQVTFDLNMPIYDGGITSNTKKYNKLTSDLDFLKTEITIFQLKEHISKIYLSVFFADENLEILNLYINNLSADIEKVTSLVNNGVMLKSNLDALEMEKLKVEQQKTELLSQRKYLMSVLSEYSGKELNNAVLTLPEVEVLDMGLTSLRPEFETFGLQIESLNYQKKLLSGESYPKLNLFATGGYARPTYNFFNVDFGWQYMVGATLKIPLMNWFKTKTGHQYISIQQELIDLQKSDYEINNRIQLLQKLSNIEKYSQMMEQDDAIVKKCENMTSVAKTQLEEGTITANDYLKELNKQTEAMLKQKLHALQLLQVKIEFNALKGDLSIQNRRIKN